MRCDDSYRYTRVKDTYSAPCCTARLAQECVTELKSMTVHSVEALMTALTRSLFQSSKQTAFLCSCILEVQSSGTADRQVSRAWARCSNSRDLKLPEDDLS